MGLLFVNAEIVQSVHSVSQLNAIGFAIGVRVATRLAAARFPITAERSAMKYVCKELWAFLFRKPANRLQTDRRGNYIIQDTNFRWLEQFSPTPASSNLEAEIREAAL